MAKTPTKSKPKANQLVAAANIPAVTNSLSGLAAGFSLNPFASMGGHGAQISNLETLFLNNRWYMLSNLRQLCSELYVEHGVIQTLVDQPVDDAFRSGFEIHTDQLSPDEVDDLQYFLENMKVIKALKQAMKWARLFGGGAVLIITEQDSITPFDITKLKEGQRIEFRAIDMWELYYGQQAAQGSLEVDGLDFNQEFFDYYGRKIHRSRVLIVKGKEAPSFIRPRLRGWGMSELEKVVRSLNQYLKNQDVVFELLDEAKIDVYKISGMNTLLLDAEGTAKVSARIQAANVIKNYLNALTMDTEDEYEQKTISFAGLPDILVQIRQGLAADLKMPMTKLFGISAAGFNSGEDDIENYNAMIESDIRSQCKFLVVDLVQIACQIKFGMVPDDLRVTFNPLRILNAEEEEKVKDYQFNRIMKAQENGLLSPLQAKQAINKNHLIPIEIDETDELSLDMEEERANLVSGEGKVDR